MRVLVRTTVIAALFALFFVAVEAKATDDAVGADIGVGLLAFALVFLALPVAVPALVGVGLGVAIRSTRQPT